MNNFLATIFGYFNALVAIILIIGCTLLGDHFGSIEVLVLVGFFLSILVCGMLALVISIRNKLVSIRKILNNHFCDEMTR